MNVMNEVYKALFTLRCPFCGRGSSLKFDFTDNIEHPLSLTYKMCDKHDGTATSHGSIPTEDCTGLFEAIIGAFENQVEGFRLKELAREDDPVTPLD